MPTPLRVLVVEDSPDDAELLLLEIERGGYEVSWQRVDSAAGMEAVLAEKQWDLIVSDYEMPRFSAPEALARLQRSGLDIPFIIVSGVVGEEVAVAALKAGAHDFIPKGRLTRLLPAIRRELDEADQRRQRKQAEAALLASERRYRTLFESAGSVIISLSTDGRILEWNPEAERVYAWSRQEALGRNYYDILPRAERAAVEADLQKVMEGRETRNFENSIVSRKGDVRVMAWNVTRLLDARGEAVGVIAIGQDVTERKRTEAARKEEGEIAAALARLGRDMVSSLDTPALLQQLCRSTAEVLECDFSHVYLLAPEKEVYVLAAGFGDSPEQLEAARMLQLPVGTAFEAAELLTRGGVLDVSPSAEFDMPGGRAIVDAYGITGALVVGLRCGDALVGALSGGYRLREASFTPKQRRILEGIAQIASLAIENSRLFANLEHANRLKSEFVATMSHELRTPLNIIIGYNDLLLEESYGTLTAEQVDALSRAQRSAGDLLQLINGILDLSRLDVGEVPVDIQDVSLPEIVEEVVGSARGACDRTELSIVSAVPDGISPLRTDRMKLLVILRNLVSNGVKFSERGTVTVEAGARDGGVEFCVRDTGIGIDPEVMPIIFEPFRQGDASMTRRFGGVGLGLYVVRRLVDVLGGRVEVESAVGKGSTFRVWMPGSAR